MLTLKKDPSNVKICDMQVGKKLVDVWYHPVKNPDLRNAVEDVTSFFDSDFKDQFELSDEQSRDIIQHLKAGTVSEKYQKLFFRVKKSIQESLYSEMNIMGTGSNFQVNFPPGNDTWPSNMTLIGSTNSGKTHKLKTRILNNLNGPKRNKRQFLIFSSEWESDRTMSDLKADKYKEFIYGKEISDQAFKDSDYDTVEDFFKYEIMSRWENAQKGTVCCFDDPRDSAEGLGPLIRNLINRALRVSRHKFTGICFVLHRIRAGAWSQQSANSSEWFCLFPRSQKGKVTAFLNMDMGQTMREARKNVAQFSAHGRGMYVHMYAPNCLITDTLIRLI